MRQLKAEYYKLKYSRATKWIALFMVFIMFIPFIVGNDTLFMTFGDYKKIDSIGWICYIDNLKNVKFAEIARFALSINFFAWVGLVVYITSMISAEYQLGTLRATVAYGTSKSKVFFSKLAVLNSYYFAIYLFIEIVLITALGWKYEFSYNGKQLTIFIGILLLNICAMLGLEMVAVILTVLIKNTGTVTALSCIYFFAGAITYPMVYENFENRSILIKVFCALNPTTYMYNICGYRIWPKLIVATIIYGICICFVGSMIVHFVLVKQEN